MIDVRTGELGAPVALRIPGWKPGTPTVRDLKIAIKSKAKHHLLFLFFYGPVLT